MSTPRPGTLRRNTLLNLAGATLPALLALAIVPALLSLIGQVRYGALAIIWTLLSYFGVLDLGFGQATSNRVATLKDAPKDEIRRVFWTALSMNAALGLAGSVILLFAANYLIGSVFKIAPPFRAEALRSVPWLALGVPLVTTAMVLIGTLEGQERFGTINVLGVSGTLLMQLCPLLLAWLRGPDLEGLVAVTILARLAGNLATLVACLDLVGLSWPSFDSSHIGGLFRFGGWISISAAANAVLSTADRFILGTLQGMVAVTDYTVPFNLVNRLSILPSSLGRTLFPRFAMIGEDSADALMRESTAALVAVMTPIVVGALIGLREFLVLWVGRAQATASAPAGAILLLGVWICALNQVPYFFHQGRGRPDLNAKFHMLEILPFLALLWMGIRYWGVEGAALAWTLRVLADGALLFGAAKMPLHRQALLIPAVVLLGSAYALTIAPLSLPVEAAAGAALLVASGLWAWSIAPPPLRVVFERFARRKPVADEPGVSR